MYTSKQNTRRHIPLWGPCILLIEDWAFGPSHVASGSLWNSCLKSVNLPSEKAWAKDAGQLIVQYKCPTENQGAQCHFQGGLVAHCCCTPQGHSHSMSWCLLGPWGIVLYGDQQIWNQIWPQQQPWTETRWSMRGSFRKFVEYKGSLGMWKVELKETRTNSLL